MDDNEEILKLVSARLELGKEKYGHGVIVDNDTKKYGTDDNDWKLMALEEMLDGIVYTTAAIIRHKRRNPEKIKDDIDERWLMLPILLFFILLACHIYAYILHTTLSEVW